IVQRDDQIPAIDLSLVERLRAVIETGGVAEADGVRGRKQPERWMWLQDTALIEQRETAFELEHTLDDEHHVRTPGGVLVEHQRARTLQRPGEDAGLKLGDLPPLAYDDGVLADQIHAAHVSVEIDTDAWPVEPRRHLLDVTGLAGAVTALHHHAPVVHEA